MPPRSARVESGPEDVHVASARAVYDASADRYVEFVGTEITATIEGAVDRSMLAAFAELIATPSPTRVVDAGCGPGRVASFLASGDIDVVGIDVSLGMLRAARSAHPSVAIAQGRLDQLPIEGGSVGGVVCWYSIIHTPPERLGDVFAEMRRVLATTGHLLLAFQAGDGRPVRREDAHGTKLALTSYRHAVADVSGCLGEAGFEVHATAERRPCFEHESSPQAFVIARRTVGG